VDRPGLNRPIAPPLEERRQGRVEDGENKIKSQRGIEQFIGQPLLRPKSEQTENE
jgi:hypothetical protein